MICLVLLVTLIACSGKKTETISMRDEFETIYKTDAVKTTIGPESE